MKNLWILILCCSYGIGVSAQDVDEALFDAIFDRDMDAVVTAVEDGANLKKRYNYERSKYKYRGWSIMHVAAAAGDEKILKYLHEQGGDIHNQIPNGKNDKVVPNGLLRPLHLAAKYHRVSTIKYLLEQGAKVDVKANYNKTPLVFAVEVDDYDKVEAISLLIEHGADVNVKHRDDLTVLMSACSSSKYNMAKLLLEKGADPNVLCEAHGMERPSAMYYAILKHEDKILSLLYKHGAKLVCEGRQYKPLLHTAVKINNLYAANLLVQKGINLKLKSTSERTALDIAKAIKNSSMIYLLEEGKLKEKDQRMEELLLSEVFEHFEQTYEKVSELDLKDLEGNEVTFEQYKGEKVLLLNVWATWCGPCIEEMPSFKALKEKAGSNLVVMASSVDRELEEVKAFAQKEDYPFVYLHDPEKRTFSVYPFYAGIPSSFIIDKNGRVVLKVFGSIDWDKEEYVEYLELLLE